MSTTGNNGSSPRICLLHSTRYRSVVEHLLNMSAGCGALEPHQVAHVRAGQAVLCTCGRVQTRSTAQRDLAHGRPLGHMDQPDMWAKECVTTQEGGRDKGALSELGRPHLLVKEGTENDKMQVSRATHQNETTEHEQERKDVRMQAAVDAAAWAVVVGTMLERLSALASRQLGNLEALSPTIAALGELLMEARALQRPQPNAKKLAKSQKAQAKHSGVRRIVFRAARRARYASDRIASSLSSSSSSQKDALLQLRAQHKRYSGHGSIQELADHFEEQLVMSIRGAKRQALNRTKQQRQQVHLSHRVGARCGRGTGAVRGPGGMAVWKCRGFNFRTHAKADWELLPHTEVA